MLGDIMSRDHCPATGGPNKSGQHAGGRALARAVGAEKSKDFALPHLEVHMIDCDAFAKGARESFRDDGLDLYRRGRLLVLGHQGIFRRVTALGVIWQPI